MYVIDRRRISFVLICVMFGIFTYFYEGTKIDLEQGTQPTVSTPVSGKVIVIDAGHPSCLLTR